MQMTPPLGAHAPTLTDCGDKIAETPRKPPSAALNGKEERRRTTLERIPPRIAPHSEQRSEHSVSIAREAHLAIVAVPILARGTDALMGSRKVTGQIPRIPNIAARNPL